MPEIIGLNGIKIPETPLTVTTRRENAPRTPRTPRKVTPKEIWKPTVMRADEIEARQVEFLWRPYIPMGTVTMLYGHGGLGKSWITCALAADLSAGRPLPGNTEALPPQKILIVSAEDDPGNIIIPRLTSMDANLSNIFISDDHFTLNERGVGGLKAVMEQFSATIVFLDPLVTFLGDKVDINKANEARASIAPLMEAAKQTNSAVVIVHHSRKDGTGRMSGRAMGSVDFVNSARSTLMVEELDGGGTVMRHAKHNWSKKGQDIAYTVTDDERFEWLGTPNEVHLPRSMRPKEIDKARALIKELLIDGPVPMKHVIDAGIHIGLSTRTMMRAKEVGQAKSRKIGNVWHWELSRSLFPETIEEIAEALGVA